MIDFGNMISTAGKAIVGALNAMPYGAIIKAGILVGVAAYTTYVLVKHLKKTYCKVKQKKFESPVDELLDKDFSNPENYDTLEDLAIDIGDDIFKKIRKSKKTGKKKSKNRTVYDAETMMEKKKELRKRRKEAYFNLGKTMDEALRKQFGTWDYMDEADSAARSLGLDVPNDRDKYKKNPATMMFY